jgi:hypothetical protein
LWKESCLLRGPDRNRVAGGFRFVEEKSKIKLSRTYLHRVKPRGNCVA